MTTELPMGVLGPDGTEETWKLILKEGGGPSLALTSPDGLAWSAAGDDLFEMLQRIRLQIEPSGYLLLCNGARIDVHPSGMLRDMAGGSILYVLRMKMVPRMRVYIFDRADPAVIGTVAAQQDFYRSWLAVPRRQRIFDRVRDFMIELWARWRDR